MERQPITLCPITKLEVLNSTIQTEFYEYSIKYDGTLYELRLTLDHDWEKINSILESYRLVLQAMLCNDEWPLEKETIITPNLIDRIIRLVQFPRDFDQKLEHYLLYCFKSGGNEYKTIHVDLKKYVVAYCENEEQFVGILHGLRAKKLVEFENDVNDAFPAFRLTEEGINKAKTFNSHSKGLLESLGNLPEITIVSTDKDEFYYQKLKQLLEKEKIKVHSYRDVRQDTVTRIKRVLYSNENGYTIFIKSKNSDDSKPFGTVLGIAIESHQNTEKIEFDYLYFAAVDDSDVDIWPRVRDYLKYFYDFRIIPCRDQLLNAIIADWNKRQESNNSKYNFPQFDIDESERLWLETIYQKFLGKEKFDSRALFASMWDEFPRDFDPKNINPLLMSKDSEITLLGISAIDPQSKIFELFEKTIFTIREILKTNSNVKTVESKDINQLLNVPEIDLFQVFCLIRSIRLLSRGSGTNDNNHEFSLNIDDDEIYKQYRNFTGLKNFLTEYVNYEQEEQKKRDREDLFFNEKQAEKDAIEKKEQAKSINSLIDPDIIDSHKTKISIRDHNVSPVMGVTELAFDMAEMIDALPIQVEKGQMIGIFGKWGRGKTFLLREIWKVLSTKKADENLIYSKVEYHAWKYQETPASWAYLYENFVDVYLGSKNGFCNRLKYYRKLYKLNYRRNGIWSIIKFALPLVSSLVVTICLPLMLKWIYALPLISIFLTVSIPVINKFSNVFSTKAIDLIKLYGNRHSYKNSLGLQAEIQKELIDMLEVWIPNSFLGKNKIILFVEDIDRCTEERIIENVDALRVLLEDEAISKRVIIITAIDERILKNAIKIKYDTIISESNSNINELISEYLDKLFISAVKLGILTENQRNEYIRELLEQESDKETLQQYDFNLRINKRKESFEKNGLSDKMIKDLVDQPFVMETLDKIDEENKLFSQIEDKNFDMNVVNGDFIIEDEDISAINESGITLNQVKKNLTDRIQKQNAFENLSQVEIGLIINVVKKWGNATPRQIRIFYYRYLLCKNLIINKYNANQTINIWQNKQGIETLINWILKYTDDKNPNAISEEKRNIISSTEEYLLFKDITTMTIKKEDCLIVHEILELVIAY